jgi:hypothetical protein
MLRYTIDFLVLTLSSAYRTVARHGENEARTYINPAAPCAAGNLIS